MNALNRFTDIINANLHALLDKAEQPEKMLRLLVQQMEDSLAELRTLAAEHIAERKQLQRQLQQLDAAVTDWQQKAERALAHDKEDLARAALAERLAAEEKRSSVQQEDTQSQSLLADIEGDISRLQSKLNEARQRYHQTQRRADCTEVRMQVQSKQHQDKITEAMHKFERYEQKIDGLEAQLEAMDLGRSASSTSLKQQFQSLEQQEAIEQALVALKQKQPHKETSHA
ncbi:PspA/IM30 family protein [Alkalimonas amylolytica]|uniref:Phage shock protein A (PspA) family protein n=1 Tax=Alkalimonas amylolytica TaxID=152573 RepID=A0A1H4FEJ3_ALKAM|nr:PspA/IM30 family protein [Alkalimonas amylolytica]SEA95706.1 phage shock protein A (PspA) family protein [Alkalimonas amylolytica]